MSATRDELKLEFTNKRPTLIAELETWFRRETEAIDGSIESGAPSGSGGSILQMRPAIDSKRVIDATVITKNVLGIELPPEIIKPGGYVSCDAMINDIIPKLERVFLGDIKTKRRSPSRVREAA
jgi:hypothetical protein